MPRITKGQIEAAQSGLESIRELAKDSFNGEAACYQYHANSANNYIATLEKADKPLPKWLLANWRYLKVLGWRGDFLFKMKGESQ